jgi:hypothetical protein
MRDRRGSQHELRFSADILNDLPSTIATKVHCSQFFTPIEITEQDIRILNEHFRRKWEHEQVSNQIHGPPVGKEAPQGIQASVTMDHQCTTNGKCSSSAVSPTRTTTITMTDANDTITSYPFSFLLSDSLCSYDLSLQQRFSPSWIHQNYHADYFQSPPIDIPFSMGNCQLPEQQSSQQVSQEQISSLKIIDENEKRSKKKRKRSEKGALLSNFNFHCNEYIQFMRGEHVTQVDEKLRAQRKQKIGNSKPYAFHKQYW